MNKKGFTLIELLLTVGIIAILAVFALLTLNPTQLVNQSNDANRVAGLSTLNKAVSLYYSEALNNPSTLFLGTSSVAYVSIPDPNATSTAGSNCAGLGLPAISLTYHCSSPSNYLKVDGTGWVPINFTKYPAGTPLSVLPRDPANTVTSGEYFIYVTNGTDYELLAQPASAKDASSTDDFQKGTNTTLLPSFPSGSSSSTPSSSQNVWVADAGNYRIQEFNASGTYISQFGSYGSGNGQFAWLFPKALACPSPSEKIAIDSTGNIWVTDSSNNNLQEFSSTGSYIRQVGSTGSGNGQFNGAFGVAVGTGGNVYVADASNARVEEFSPTGAYITSFGTSGPGTLSYPHALTVDASGNVWVTDWTLGTVNEYTSTGTYIKQFGGTYGPGNGEFEGLFGIAIASNGNIYISDEYTNRIQIFNSNGTYLSQFGTAGSGNGQFNMPLGLALDSSGNLWVADYGNNRIQEFTSNGTYITQFGSTGSGNGQFEQPYGIAIH